MDSVTIKIMVCYFSCLYLDLMYTVTLLTKTQVQDQGIFWLPVFETTCTVVAVLFPSCVGNICA